MTDDPWGHEVGDDTGHALDASGHARHYRDPVAHLVGAPVPAGAIAPVLTRKRSLDWKAVIGLLVVTAVLALAIWLGLSGPDAAI